MGFYSGYLFLLVWVSCTLANNCSIPPLVLKIENNTLSGDGIALNRGISCSIGGEVEGLRLDFARNNTNFRNYLDCASAGSTANISQCVGASGGVYNLNTSSTFRAVTNNAWNVTSIDPSPNGAHIIRGYDTATFGPSVSIPNFPFEIWSDPTSANRSSLGFGINSSVITSFLSTGAAPSGEIGLFYGSRSVDHPSDGELVIGGYNPSRVNGSFTNFTMITSLGQPCALQVYIKDVVVSNINGSQSSVMPISGSRIPACVNPVENGFQFTPEMFTAWANATQKPKNPPSDGSKNYTDQTYPLANEKYINDMTIILDGGYSVTIPHYELVSFERGNNARGIYDIVNTSRIASAVTSNGGRFTFPILGGVFLSQNYLKVDYANRVFSLAHAVTDVSLSNTSIASTCVQNNAPPVSPSPIPITPTPSPSSTPTPAQKTLAPGPTVGIAIGSAAFAALLIAAGYFLWRKFKNGPQIVASSPSNFPLFPSRSSVGGGTTATGESMVDTNRRWPSMRRGTRGNGIAELPSPGGG
ncbi:aspartic peptidase domain-containing protein [Tricladium varicosporioides]|nr:aspartic peptidase domain-containing protein [Hymenoscyphus varicosporioides]